MLRSWDLLRAAQRGAWRPLPHDYPAWSTVYDYFRKRRNAGLRDHLMRTLRERLRVQAGRNTTPVLGLAIVNPSKPPSVEARMAMTVRRK